MSRSKKIILNENNVIRHCSSAKLLDNLPTYEAFMMKKKDIENGLSVNWLEFYPDDFETSLDLVRKDVKKRLTVNNKHRLIKLNVGKTKKLVEDYKSLIFFTYENEGDSHSYITGYSPEDEIIADMIAQNVSEEEVFLAIKD